MLTNEERTKYTAILEEIKKNDTGIHIDALSPYLSKLDEADRKTLNEVFLQSTHLQYLSLRLTKLDEEQITATIDFINTLMTPKDLILIMQPAPIEKIADAIQRIKNLQIKEISLSNLQLGQYDLITLEPLLKVLDKCMIHTLRLYNNSLHLLNDNLPRLLERLLKNDNIQYLKLIGNNLSSLSLPLLATLHNLQYTNKQPVRLWPYWENAREQEFKDNSLDEEKKYSLAKLILQQALNSSYIYEDKEPIPFSLSGSQYFQLYDEVLDQITEKQMNQFNTWQLGKDRGIADNDKLLLSKKVNNRFPNHIYLIGHLKLNTATGPLLPEECLMQYLDWLMNRIKGYKETGSRLSAFSIAPYTLNKPVIDKLQQTLTLDPDLSIALSLSQLSDEMISYLGNMLATQTATKRHYQKSITILNLELNKIADVEKLKLFLSGFPKQSKIELEISSANLGLATSEIIERMATINFPATLKLHKNNLEKLGPLLLPLLQGLNANIIDVEQNSLWKLPDHILNPLFAYFKASSKQLAYHYDVDCTDLPIDQQRHHAERELQFEMLHNNTSLDSLSYLLPNEIFFELFSHFIREAPNRSFKVAHWQSIKNIKLDYQQRLSLAKQQLYSSTVHCERGSISSSASLSRGASGPAGYKLNVIDTLALFFESYQIDPDKNRYPTLVKVFENVIQDNSIDMKFPDLEEVDDEKQEKSALETKKENTHVAPFLRDVLLKTCETHWPTIHFYERSLQKLIDYRIDEEYDTQKLANMVAWFSWVIANLIHKKIAISEEKEIDTRYQHLERTVKEILNFTNPERRVKLSEDLFIVFENRWSLAIFNQLAPHAPQRATLPALMLAKIIFLNNDIHLQDELIAKSIEILAMVSTNYSEGRFLRSFINALISLSATENVSAQRKIAMIYQVLNLENEKRLMRVLEKFAYSLVEITSTVPRVMALRTEALTNMQIHLANDEFPPTLLQELNQHLHAEKDIPKPLANRLKRQWQAQTLTFQRNRHFVQQLHFWYLIQGLCELNQAAALFNGDEIGSAARDVLGQLFNLDETQKESYDAILANFPDQAAVLTYLGKINCLSDEGTRLALRNLYNRFIQEILTPQSEQFYMNRYNLQNSVHLATVFKDNPLFLSQWKKGARVDLKKFMDENPVKTHRPQLSIERFLYEKIFLHKHLCMPAPELQAFMQAKSEDEKQSIKDRLTTLLKMKKSVVNKTDYRDRGNLALLYFQRDLILLLAQPDLKDSEKVDLLRRAARNLNATYQYSEFDHDLYFLIDSLIPKTTRTKSVNYSKWTIVDTDHFWHLFTCGNLPGSCQRVDGNPERVKSLLAYVMDGKNRLFAILDETGKLVARVIARMMHDPCKKSPVLFMEEYYYEGKAANLSGILQMFAMARARELGVPLVGSTNHLSRENHAYYKNNIKSLSSVAPSEYVDAIHHQVKDGIFEIPQPLILQKRIPKHVRCASQDDLPGITFFSKATTRMAKDDLSIQHPTAINSL